MIIDQHMEYPSLCKKRVDEQPLLSVVVAVYNIESYIEKCIRSLMTQTYGRLEIILVDDGATDDSGKICDRLAREDDRIIVIHKENGGLSDARNAGTEIAQGEYIAYVDGDDWIEDAMYEKMLSAMCATDADMGICRYAEIIYEKKNEPVVVDRTSTVGNGTADNYQERRIDDGSSRTIVMEGLEALQIFLAEDDKVCIRNAAWNKVYKRETLGELRFPKGRWYEDIVYTTILLSKIKRAVYLDQCLYNYVVNREGSIMSHDLNPRIFTDQIGNYKEKEQFLQTLGNSDYVNMHRYFYLKRLLQYYIVNVEQSDYEKKRKNRRQIIKLVKEYQVHMNEIYTCSCATRNEACKMKIFLFSPSCYYLFVKCNELIRLPLKNRC
ncbi:MAG: glycosyltransferase [Eubacteriales bacterium]